MVEVATVAAEAAGLGEEDSGGIKLSRRCS
jgi:hypothetical protein